MPNLNERKYRKGFHFFSEVFCVGYRQQIVLVMFGFLSSIVFLCIHEMPYLYLRADDGAIPWHCAPDGTPHLGGQGVCHSHEVLLHESDGRQDCQGEIAQGVGPRV